MWVVSVKVVLSGSLEGAIVNAVTTVVVAFVAVVFCNTNIAEMTLLPPPPPKVMAQFFF